MVKDILKKIFKGSAHVFLGFSEIYCKFPPSIRGKELASWSSDIMAEECAAISPAILQAAYGQGTSSSLLLNFRSPNTLFPDLPLMRSWIASLVFCGNSSGKLVFLCMALAWLWQLLLKIGLLLGKISCLKQPGAGLISIGASDWWRWESCWELYSCKRASPTGGHQGPGLEASKAFLEFVLSNDSRLWNVYSRVIPENSSKTGEKKSVLTSNEGWTKQWVLTLENSITLWAPWMYLQNEKELGCAGERRKLLRQLGTPYLSST